MALSGARVLLTGASGFIGAHCLERLLYEKAELHAVSRRGHGPHAGRVTWHGVDLRDARAAHRLVATVRPTHVLHSAWNAVPGRFWTDPDNLGWLEGGLGLLRGFADVGGARFVGVGTCAEYDWSGDGGDCREDETPIRPATLYGKAKAAMWASTQAYAAQAGFTAAWGRLFLPYGPGDHEQRLIPSLVATINAGEVFTLRADAERDFIYAPDAADLLVRLLSGDAQGAFNIATGVASSVRALAGDVAIRLGRPDLLHIGAEALGNEPARLVADMAKVQSSLHWCAPTDLKRGLDQVLGSV